VRTHLPARPLRRRVVALIAAYAIALSGLIASFGAARAAAEAADAAALAAGIICHTSVAASEAPASGQGNDRHCAANCCIGCLLLVAAVPAPPAKIIGTPASASEPIAAPHDTVLGGGQKTKDHRSRAPPSAA
jgi:hypothetical protein